MELTGELYLKGEVTETKSGFKKREFILTDYSKPEYPQYISFQLIKDKCNIIDKIKEGTMIKVHFNINGREWTNPEGKKVYFNSLNCWKIDYEKEQEEKQPDELFNANEPILPNEDSEQMSF